MAGATGAGKSTLVTTMCLLLPAEFISDDTVWLSGGYAEGMGAPISVRRGSPWYSIASGLPYGGDLDRILVNPADLGVGFQHGTRAVSHLLFPTYRPYEPSLAAELTPAASFCRLVSSAFRVSRSDEYDELAAVAASARSMSLTYPDSGSSIKLVRRALAMNPLDALIPSRVEPDEMTCEGFGPDTGAIRFGDECAIWNKATGQIAHVAAWPAGRPLRGEVAWTQLESMGFVGGDLP